MNINDFITHFAEQFDETDAAVFKPETNFRDLDEWNSLIALSVIAMIDEEYDVIVKGNDVKQSITIQDLFDLVCAKKNS